MQSAALGHQYLTVKAFNKNDHYFGTGRFRGGRNHQAYASQINPSDEQLISSISANDPRSQQPSALLEEAIPNVAIIQRSPSDTTGTCVVYQHPSKNDTVGEEVVDSR